MPRRALVNHRPWLLASLIAGISYFFVQDDAIGGLWLMSWKGAGVAFLALYAARRAPGSDGVLITLALIFAAAGDVALELSFLFGGLLFAIAHLFAIILYIRNRRPRLSRSQKLAIASLLLLTPVTVFSLTYALPNWQLATAYGVVIGAMAAAAWGSSFSRYRIGTGVVFFLVSDLLIFARESDALHDTTANWLIWPLYFGGQFMIATGVVQTLRKTHLE